VEAVSAFDIILLSQEKQLRASGTEREYQVFNFDIHGPRMLKNQQKGWLVSF
jgi:hypothetical protein